MTSFAITEAVETTDLLNRTWSVTVRWEVKPEQEQVVIYDLLDRLMSVTKVSVVADENEVRVYLGGHRVSKVNHKTRDADSLMPTTIDIANPLATLIDLDLDLQPVRSKGAGVIDIAYFRNLA